MRMPLKTLLRRSAIGCIQQNKVPMDTLVDWDFNQGTLVGYWQLPHGNTVVINARWRSYENELQLLPNSLEEAAVIQSILVQEPTLALHILGQNTYVRANDYESWKVIFNGQLIMGTFDLLRYVNTKVKLIKKKDYIGAKRFDKFYPKGLNVFLRNNIVVF